MPYTAAEVSHLTQLPRGHPERSRVFRIVEQMQRQSLGACSNYAECEAVCPKKISIKFIGYMNRESLKETLARPLEPRGEMPAQ